MTLWSVVPEFDNYKISSDGEVINMTTGKTVSVSLHKHGHRVFRVWKNNTTKLLKVYRIKAICFIPNPENKREVNHKDGNRMNEDLANLEWATPSENMKHAYETGLSRGTFGVGSKHQLRKLSIRDIENIRSLRAEGKPLKELGIMFNVTPDHICRVSRHKQTIEYERL